MSAAIKFARHARQINMNRVVREYLFTRGGFWTLMPTITSVTGVTGPEMRTLCQAYPSTYISSQHGYKLAQTATKTEVRECVQSLIGRADKIMHRASALTGRLA